MLRRHRPARGAGHRHDALAGVGYRHEALSPATRRAAVLAGAGVTMALVPWSAFLARTLPSSTRVRHWALAWTGLDVAEAAAAGASAWLLGRDDRRAAASLASLTGLLVADAWFDVCTASAGRDLRVAVAEALGLELPLAVAAAALAVRLVGAPHPDKAFAHGDEERDEGGAATAVVPTGRLR